ncbi:MAG: CD225/dispanin family protein [Bacteroides sp.]|nr:CD225/dispanin family protein [Bacteroides sp.]
MASRVHCQIIMDDYGKFRLVDTASTNGTYVNGVQRHGEVMLNKTDIIRIGNTTIPWQNYFNVAQGTVMTPSPAPPVENEQKPDNFLVWSILGTLFCCLPFGIAAIVYSSKVDGLWASGRYSEAKAAASKARTWFWWSFGIGILLNIFIIIYYCFIGAVAICS